MKKAVFKFGLLAVCVAGGLWFYFSSQNTQPTLVPLKFQIDWKAEPFYAGVYAAKELGYFAEEGLNVEILQGNGAANAATQIGASSEPWVGTSSATETVLGISKGLPVASSAVIIPKTPFVLVSLPRSPIQKPSDLVGKRIGLIPGTVSTSEFYALLAVNKIARDKIKPISVDWSVTPLLSGDVDGLIYSADNVPLQLRLDGHNPSLMWFRDYGVNMYGMNIIVNTSINDKKKKLTLAATRAVVKGYEYLRANPEKTAAVFLKAFPERDKTYVTESVKIVRAFLADTPVGQQNATGWHGVISFLTEQGLLKSAVEDSQAFINLPTE